MGKKQDISPTRRAARIIEMREQEKSYDDISKKLKCSKSAAKRVKMENHWFYYCFAQTRKTTKDR